MFPSLGVGVLSILSTVRTDTTDLRPVDSRRDLVPVRSHRVDINLLPLIVPLFDVKMKVRKENNLCV